MIGTKNDVKRRKKWLLLRTNIMHITRVTKKSKLQPPTNGFKVHTYGYEKYRNNVCRQIHDGAYTYREREGEIEQANAVSE